jgi:hypothetical protein
VISGAGTAWLQVSVGGAGQVIVGGVTSTVHVTVCEVEDVLLHASIAVQVLVCDLLHDALIMGPSFVVTVGVLQASVAVAEPSAALIAAEVGLQPGGNGVCVIVITGAVRSSVHVTVLVSVAVLPQASVAINVLVCDLLQDVLTIAPSLDVTVGAPHASVAVAEPSAALIAAAEGLQPGGNGVCVIVISGAVISAVHVTVREVEVVLLHASIAIHVLVCDLLHDVLTILPSLDDTVGVPQASVAVALPSAALISPGVGLQPGGNGVCVIVIPGAVRSSVHVTVLVSDAVLPQASVAINVLVCDLLQEVLTIAPSFDVTVGVPHASVAVAEPSAALIAAAEGLQPGGNGV